MLRTTPAALESKVITQYVTQRDNTHNSTISNSIGMALLYLKNTMPDADIDLECNRLLTEINDYITELERKTTPTDDEKILLKNLDKSAVSAILAETKEGYKHWDTLTLYLPDGKSLTDEKSYVDKEVKFHIKEVIALVWNALNQDEKFAHHYSGTFMQKLLAAKNDRTKRLESFFNCLKEVKQVCHQGKRNALVRLLNKTYDRIQFIEDDISTIMDFTKEAIERLFFNEYETADAATKKLLTRQLTHWMVTGEATPLINTLDPSQKILVALTKLFIHHGTNPRNLEKNFMSIIECLGFSFDITKRGAHFHWAYQLLNEEAKETCALTFMKTWLAEEWQLDSELHKTRIANFYSIYTASKKIREHRLMLAINHEKYTALSTEIEKYLNGFAFAKESASVIFPATDKIDFTLLQELTKDIKKLCKENYSDFIENFFATNNEILAAYRENRNDDNLKRLRNFFELAYDKSFQKKVLLDDDAIAKIHDEKTKIEVVESKKTKLLTLSPYEINRFILHALMTPPEEWSENFADSLKQIYALISAPESKETDKDNFIKHSYLEQLTKRSSYHPNLLNRLEYLIRLYDKTPITKEPSVAYLYPSSIKTIKDWMHMFCGLSLYGIRNKVYDAYADVLEPLALKLLKPLKQIDFSYFVIITWDERGDDGKRFATFLQKIGREACLEIINNSADRLATILRLLDMQYQMKKDIFFYLGPDFVRSVMHIDTISVPLLGAFIRTDDLDSLIKFMGRESFLAMIGNTYTVSYFFEVLPINSVGKNLNILGAKFFKQLFSVFKDWNSFKFLRELGICYERDKEAIHERKAIAEFLADLSLVIDVRILRDYAPTNLLPLLTPWLIEENLKSKYTIRIEAKEEKPAGLSFEVVPFSFFASTAEAKPVVPDEKPFEPEAKPTATKGCCTIM